MDANHGSVSYPETNEVNQQEGVKQGIHGKSARKPNKYIYQTKLCFSASLATLTTAVNMIKTKYKIHVMG